MPEYRRIDAAGATIFFTLVTYRRRPIFASKQAVDLLRESFRTEMQHHAFTIDAIVILPDHLHCIWTLPAADARFSIRWSLIKGSFTRAYLASGGHEGVRTASRFKRGERGVWQRRFWDHVIRDVDDFGHHMDYIHYNPVKHGHASCPHGWPYSSFDRWAAKGVYPADWMCTCTARSPSPPDFSSLEGRVGE